MMIYICLACLLLFLYFLVQKNSNYWKSKGVPYEKPFLFFGSIYSVATGKEHFCERVRAIYNHHSGPYVGVHVFTRPYLMLRSPELIRKVLVKDSDKFINRNFGVDEKADPITYHAIFSSRDANWKNIRSKMSPVFTSGKMKMMYPLMKDCAKELAEFLERNDEKTVGVWQMAKRYTVDVISSCAFGINAYCLKNEDSEMMKMATQLFDIHSVKRNLSAFCYFFLPLFVKVFQLRFMDKEAADYLSNVFKETMKEREAKKIVRNDLIDLLDNLRKKESSSDSFKFDDIKMASQAVSFVQAGTDTTSSMMSLTLYELALHKHIQDRLREEIKESYEKHGDITYESLHQLKYLDMVFNEALRKYPFVTFVDRISMGEYTFQETGLTIDKDTVIMIPTCGIHFDPEYYPEPEQFIPERFRDENKKNIKPFTFLPFGEGPRVCIGQRFAHLVGKVGLAYAVKDFVFEPAKSTQIPLRFEKSSAFLINNDDVPLKIRKI